MYAIRSYYGVIDSLGLNIPVVGLKKDNKHTTESLLAHDPIIEISYNFV